MDVVDGRIEGSQRLAQRGVQRIDGSVAVGRRMQRLSRDLDLHGGLGEELPAAALLDQAGVVDDAERGGVIGGVAPDEQLEGRLSTLERQALGLELLDEQR